MTTEIQATVGAWHQALHNASVCTSTDKARPTLTAVHVVASSDGGVILEATDSYLAIRQTVDGAKVVGQGSEWLVSGDVVKELVAKLKGWPAISRDHADAVLVFDSDRLTWRSGTDVPHGQWLLPDQGAFPRLDGIWPQPSDDDPTHSLHSIGLNLNLLAKLAKLVEYGGGRGPKSSSHRLATFPARFVFTGATRPVLVEVASAGAELAVAPTRLS